MRGSRGRRGWTFLSALLALAVLPSLWAVPAIGGPGKAQDPNVVSTSHARFTVLSPTLLRLEYSPDGVFEDRRTLLAVNRRTPTQTFRVDRSAHHWVLDTGSLVLSYVEDGSPFNARNLGMWIRPRGAYRGVRWHPGLPNHENLGGTLRTLDNVAGSVPVGDGLLSRSGWTYLDDSRTPLLEDGPDPWALARPGGGRTDGYFFGYGHDYRTAFRDFTAIAGAVPVPPKFALGSWYSRYWPYTEDDYRDIVDGYRRHCFPLDVMVLDMDWHRGGWTGYSWNRSLIPHPRRLLAELHRDGLHVTLNLHPADGLAPDEDAYPVMARALGVPAGGGKTLPLDVTDRRWMDAYFQRVLGPLESQGVDFWWVDWQQGKETQIPGLEPLTWLNTLFYRHRISRRGRLAGQSLRGLSFSRWGGLGDHRHPIHFSGDTYSTWNTLAFLVPFTVTSGNTGCDFWSHDLGGHKIATKGRADPELVVRWIQSGVFTGAMRVHSSRDALNDRRPWLDGYPFEEAARRAFALRYRLLPYVYQSAWECHETGVPPARGLYLDEPDLEAAYVHPGEFFYGRDLLVEPIVHPAGPDGRATVRVWFPPGKWASWEGNRKWTGPCERDLRFGLGDIPLFVRVGAVVPLAVNGLQRMQAFTDPLVLRWYAPGASGPRWLHEDDGETEPSGLACLPRWYFEVAPTGKGVEWRVGPAGGARDGSPMPEVVLETYGCPGAPQILDYFVGGGRKVPPACDYDPVQGRCRIRLPGGGPFVLKQVRLVFNREGRDPTEGKVSP